MKATTVTTAAAEAVALVALPTGRQDEVRVQVPSVVRRPLPRLVGLPSQRLQVRDAVR